MDLSRIIDLIKLGSAAASLIGIFLFRRQISKMLADVLTGESVSRLSTNVDVVSARAPLSVKVTSRTTSVVSLMVTNTSGHALTLDHVELRSGIVTITPVGFKRKAFSKDATESFVFESDVPLSLPILISVGYSDLGKRGTTKLEITRWSE